jgi:predicted nucleic acid-binding protein
MVKRVVLDTNVFVAAGFNAQSHSARILEAAEQGSLEHVWDSGTRGEVQAVLRQIPPLAWERWAALFREEDRFGGTTHPERFDYVADPDDRKFIALACAASATLVTSDEHLLVHRESVGISILTPGEFWEDFQGR